MKIKFGLQFCLRMLVCGVSLATLLPVSVQAQTVSWKRQFGFVGDDTFSAVATDSNGNTYVAGLFEVSLDGNIDALLVKYNSSGTLVWREQLGGSINSGFGATDSFNSVATDSNGNVYATGATGFDDWIVKYNSNGTLLWKKEFVTSGSANTSSNGVATDSNGNVYISGWTDAAFAGNNRGLLDAWVAKYTSSGALVWKRQLGTSEDDTSNGVATDSNGNVYISGSTDGALAGTNNAGKDAWLAKYDPSGTLVWKEQLGLGGPNVYSGGVATDRNSNVYISGSTNGSLAGTNSAGNDAWVAKYNSSGALVWKEQLGLDGPDVTSNSVATDSNGNVYISGSTNGSLAGTNSAGNDAWVAKYNPSGALVWKEQLGLAGPDVISYGVATNNLGNVFITGETNGNLTEQNHGKFDAWLAKYTQ